MTTYFLQNLYLGTKLTEEQLADIPNYRFELHYHVLYKGAQAGCILGMGVIGPLVGLIRGRSLKAMVKTAYKGGKIGAVTMMALSPFMTEAVIRNATEEAIYDRSFRIRKNQGQIRADRWATYGGLAGLGVGAVAGPGALAGLMVGFTAGTVSSGLYGISQAKAAKEKKKEDAKE